MYDIIQDILVNTVCKGGGKMDKRYAKFFKYFIVSAIIIYISMSLIDSVPFFLSKIFELLALIISLAKPLIIGLVIAYLLYGPMNAIENFLMNRKHFIKKRGLCRGIGILVSYVGVFGIIVAIIFGIYFMIGGHISRSSTLSNIIGSIGNYFQDNELSVDMVKHLINKYDIPFGDILMSQMGTIAGFIQGFLLSVTASIVNFIIAIGSNIVTFVIAFILSIYLLAGHEYFQDLWDKFLFVIFREGRAGRVVRETLQIINRTFSGYIRGQMIEAVIVAIMSTIVLMIVGVDDAFIIGVIAGVTNIIPYVGPFIGIGLAVIVSLLQGSWFAVIGSIVGLLIVQQVDANIFAPKVVGDNVGLNPVFVIISISIGAGLFGLIGMLVAVPIAASIKAIIARWFDAHIKNDYDLYKSNQQVEVVEESEEKK